MPTGFPAQPGRQASDTGLDRATERALARTGKLVGEAYDIGIPLEPTAVKTSLTPAYTADYHELVRVNPSVGGFTITLPSAALHQGAGLVVKNTASSTNTVTISAPGSETVDGGASVTITTAFGVRHFISDGTEWWTI